MPGRGSFACAALTLLAAATPLQAARTIVVRNNCNQPLWPGIFQQELPAGTAQPLGGGWSLPSGQSTTLTLSEGFAGRIWARKGCHFDAAGQGTCDTGDCFNGLHCSGIVGRAGTSLAEFTLWRPSNPAAFPQDWYDVSYVDGYDFPVKIEASDASYKAPSVRWDAIPNCPAGQQVRNANGVVVQCLSACTRYGTDPAVSPDLQKIYCCLPPFNATDKCSPAQYPNPPGNLNAVFKDAAPDSYSWALDDPTSVWHYPGNSNVSYAVTFCPDGVQTTAPGGGGPTPTPRPTSATPTPTPCCSGPVDVTPGAGGVTASANDGNVPGNTIDRSLATRWSASGDGQWIRYDLGVSRVVTHLTIAFYAGNVRQSRFDIQVSNDGAAWSTARAGVLSSGTSTQEQSFDVPDVTARFVRYLGHGNTVNAWNSILELHVFAASSGGPTPTASPTRTATPTPTPSPTARPTSPGAEYSHSVASVSATSAQIRFVPNGFAAGFVIAHYRVNNVNQQDVYMTYNAGAGRWEQTVAGLTAGAALTYSFTYQKAGLEYTTGWFQYMHSGGATPTPTATPCCATPIEVTPGAGGVSASANDGNLPGNAVDNNLATRWSANGDGQWIRYDLGAPRIVTHLAIAFYGGNTRQSRFDVQASNDGTSWSNVLTGALSSGTTTQEQVFEVPDTSARFVRYFGHGNTSNAWNSLLEMSVFTLP